MAHPRLTLCIPLALFQLLLLGAAQARSSEGAPAQDAVPRLPSQTELERVFETPPHRAWRCQSGEALPLNATAAGAWDLRQASHLSVKARLARELNRVTRARWLLRCRGGAARDCRWRPTASRP